MSIESLIFLAIFILLPLIERIIEMMRRRSRRPPQQRQPQPSRQGRPPAPPERREQVPLPPRHRAEVPEAPAPPRPVPSTPQDPMAPGPLSRESRPIPGSRRPPVADRPSASERERRGEGARPAPREPKRQPPPEAATTVPSTPPQPAARRKVPVVDPRSLESLEGDLTAREPVADAIAAPARKVQRRTARAVRRIIRNPTSLRRAVLVATLIGPCRALDDQRPSPRPPF